MSGFYTQKKIIYVLLVLIFSNGYSVTFKAENLKNNSMINYERFIGSKFDDGTGDSFEKLVADFNGDGFDDILSLGGSVPTCPFGCGVPTPDPAYPVKMMLYEEGEYKLHDMGYAEYVIGVLPFDIDQDDDLDLVMNNGKIALNNGNAYFDQVLVFSTETINGEYFVVDWDQDGDMDIITKDILYINDGSMNFDQKIPVFSSADRIFVNDLNADAVPDILIFADGQIQSWLNDGSGALQKISQLSHESVDFLMKAIDANGDGFADFVQSYSINEGVDVRVKLWINDGQGNLSLSDFEFGEFDAVEHTSMQITKIFVLDYDNDGDEDLGISALFRNTNDCSENQSLLVLLQNNGVDGLSRTVSLHSLVYSYWDARSWSIGSSIPTFIDLDFDERLDIVAPGEKPVVWLNKPSLAEFSLVSNHFNNHIETADFNNDGNMDIISSGKYDQGCSISQFDFNANIGRVLSTSNFAHGAVWLGDGEGGFSPDVNPGVADAFFYDTPAEYIKVTDFDEDGRVDIFMTNSAGEFPESTIYHPAAKLHAELSRRSLPVASRLIEVADMDNDGVLDVVLLARSPEAEIVLLNKFGFDDFNITQTLAFGAMEGEIKLADMDGDGWIDIIANSKSEEDSVKIWYNDGDWQFSASEPFADGVKAIAVADFNNDGKADIFTSNASHHIWTNRGNRVFDTVSYNAIFLFEYPKYDQTVISLVPEKLEIIDINGDGLIDIFAHINDDVYVFINTAATGIYYYKNYTSTIRGDRFNNTLINKSNVVFADFNNDGLLDFASGSDNSIKIISQDVVNVSTGLIYDPERSGHGYAIEEIGRDNLYFSVFYTYDDAGFPEWYSILNRYEAEDSRWGLKRINGNNKIRFLFDEQSGQVIADEAPETLGWITFSSKYNDESITRGLFRIGETQRWWRLNYLIGSNQKPENDLAGIWWAGSEDSGWGLSLAFAQRDNHQEIVVVLYFYDAAGNPRWLIGQQGSFEPGQAITIDMNQIHGYGRLQNFVELNKLPAGTISLNLNQASMNLDLAGTATINVTYQGSEGGSWIRNDIPVAMFSKPKN